MIDNHMTQDEYQKMIKETKKNKGNKFNAKKINTSDGVFDSKKEYARYQELKILEQAGEIYGLERQKTFPLLPEVREPETAGARGGVKRGKVIERACNYIADFCYYRTDGSYVVEDVKGYRRGAAYEVFKLKKKMMLYFHNIQVREV